jgi:hypothetical protein
MFPPGDHISICGSQEFNAALELNGSTPDKGCMQVYQCYLLSVEITSTYQIGLNLFSDQLAYLNQPNVTDPKPNLQ